MESFSGATVESQTFGIQLLHLTSDTNNSTLWSELRQPTRKPVIYDRIRLRQFRLFLELARTENISRAASTLGVPQPLATRNIHDLETAVGAKLFDRNRKGMRLNEYGRVFLKYVVTLFDALESASEEIQHLKDASQGHVSVGVRMSELHRLIPTSIACLNKSHPAIVVTVVQGTLEEMHSKLRLGTLNLVVGFKGPANQMHGLVHQTLFVEKYVLVAKAGHPLAGKKRIRLNDLVEYPWVVPKVDSDLRPQFDALFKQEGVAPPTKYVVGLIALFARDFAMHNHACEIGKGAGQAIHFVDHNDVDPLVLDILQQLFERGAVHAAARIAAIAVVLGNKLPALMLLALDVGFAGFPLGIQRIEILV